MAEALQAKLDAANAGSPAAAVPLLQDILLGSYPNDTDSLKVKEAALDALTEALVKQGDVVSLRSLLGSLRPWFAVIPKAKTAKLVRTIIDAIGKVPDSTQVLVSIHITTPLSPQFLFSPLFPPLSQLEVCQEQAAWATTEKRTFLRQRIDLRLASLYLATRDYPAALALIAKLLTEVKRLDDKLLLTEIHLLESKVHNAVRNLPKARAALTASRTAANAVYIAPSLQADIDTQSGTLHAEEKDFKTAYSYFYEAFEQLSNLDDVRAVAVLKYMLLCKIMAGEVADVGSIISSKGGLKHAGADVDALRAVAKAYDDRSLGAFQSALDTYKTQLQDDAVVHAHLSELYDMMLEQNLKRLIEPYSRVEVAHLASLIKLPLADVEAKLSQMILDKKFEGTLDQRAGVLDVFEEAAADEAYPAALDTIDNMSRVVDSLFARSLKIVS